MSCVTRPTKVNLRLDLQHASHKQQNFEKPAAGCSGSLSPNLQPATPPSYPTSKEPDAVSKIGKKYLLLDHLEGSSLRRCTSVHNSAEYVCKVVSNDRYKETLMGYYRLDSHPNINPVEEVLIGENKTYIIFPTCHGDLHSYVRQKRCLREAEAMRLFRQVASAVAACHESGIVLRDLKLRKVVFVDKQKTQLKLETLDDAVVLDKDDDWLNDKHGCPAYVSPEILTTDSKYSGKAADCWSLGVMLYTMLVGRYPFHDLEPSGLFIKIRRGCYTVPEFLSSKAKCLIKSLLRKDPTERLTAEEVLDHPWFKMVIRRNSNSLDAALYGASEDTSVPDQMVPDADCEDENSCLCI